VNVSNSKRDDKLVWTKKEEEDALYITPYTLYNYRTIKWKTDDVRWTINWSKKWEEQKLTPPPLSHILFKSVIVSIYASFQMMSQYILSKIASFIFHLTQYSLIIAIKLIIIINVRMDRYNTSMLNFSINDDKHTNVWLHQPNDLFSHADIEHKPFFFCRCQIHKQTKIK
jgi:hypothetical protein